MSEIDDALAHAGEVLARADREMLPKVECPKCGHWDSRVKEGRPDPRGYRRIRECSHCHAKYSTIERAA